MALRRSLCRCVSPDSRVGMSVLRPIDPGPSPRRIVNNHDAPAPIKATDTPAPRPKEPSDRYAEAEAYRPANHEPGAWPYKYYRGVIVRHRNVTRIRWQDGDIGSAGNDDLGIATQISESFGLLAFPLYRVHHILLLGQEGVAKVGSPVQV